MAEFTPDQTAAILSGPDDSIFDSIFDWITNALLTSTHVLTDFIGNVKAEIEDWITQRISSITSTLSSWWMAVQDAVGVATDWAGKTYGAVTSWISGAYHTIYTAVSSGVTVVHQWIEDGWTAARSWISSAVGQVRGWISTAWTTASSWIAAHFDAGVRTLTSWFTSSWADIRTAIGSIIGSVSSTLAAATAQISSSFSWLSSYLDQHVVGPLETVTSMITDAVQHPGELVVKIFDAIADWLNVDIPGHSPRWTAIFDNIGHWFSTWFFEFPKWFFGDFPQRVAYGLSQSWNWFTDAMQPIVTAFMDALSGFTQHLGPITPETAHVHYNSMLKVGATAVFGLVGMTVAGELLHPLKNLGLGRVAGMIFDLTEYRVITGAFMGALAAAAIGMPMRYFYQKQFRPWLPSARDTSYMRSRGYISAAQYSELQAYYGVPDEWHPMLDLLTQTPVGYFGLNNIAKNGVFVHDIYDRELHRSGYADETIKLLMDMYQKNAMSGAKPAQLSTVIGRYKAGYIGADQFAAELGLVGSPQAEIDIFLVHAKLEQATQYMNDLVTAYTDGVRSGQLSFNEFRQNLLDLGMEPNMVAAKLLIEKLRLKPSAAKTVTAVATPAYTTEQGKVEVDTIRRRRRAKTPLIDHTQEVAALVQLGMAADYAEAIAENDDIRVGETTTTTAA